MGRLTVTKIDRLKPSEKNKLYLDGDYLYLKHTPSGSKLWRFRGYTWHGKSIEIALGRYPTVTLAQAREKAKSALDDFKNGIDHRQTLKAQEQAAKNAIKNTFKQWANEWVKSKDIGDKTLKAYQSRLDNYIYPYIGDKAISKVSTQDVLYIIQKIENNNKSETADRCKMIIGMICRYAIINGVINHDPTYPLRGLIKKKTVKHMPALTNPKEIGQLMRDIKSYQGAFITQIALQIAPYVMLRPNEIRGAKWDYIDFKDKLWRIPASDMKMGVSHLVPLANQVIVLLKQLEQVTGDKTYLFPHASRRDRTMSENTLNQALITLGYKGKMVSHGFRGMASTRLYEMGYSGDYIEAQLVHKETNAVKAAYNHATYLKQRTEMMQEWADYLDELREGNNE